MIHFHSALLVASMAALMAKAMDIIGAEAVASFTNSHSHHYRRRHSISLKHTIIITLVADIAEVISTTHVSTIPILPGRPLPVQCRQIEGNISFNAHI